MERFLVRAELEPAPGWLWVRAESAQHIKQTSPLLEVARDPPPWMSEEELAGLREVSLDDRDDPLLLALRRRYQTYEPPGHLSMNDGISKNLDCRLCGHPPKDHAFDLLCPIVVLPSVLAEKAARFPESSYGAVETTIVLNDGREFPRAFVSGRQVVKVGRYNVPPGGSFRMIPFASEEIADVLPIDATHRLKRH